MIEANQFLERYRTLSRDIQNGLQTVQKNLEDLKKTRNWNDLDRINEGISNVSESWQDFAGWVLISTLENIEDAKKNCAPGRLDIQSKLKRAKHKRQRDLGAAGINVDTRNVISLVIESYIPYFEQLIDLVLSNAIKYSPRAGQIEISADRAGDLAKITISSMGPLVEKHERASLGQKGFRSDAAKRLPLSGDGFGLFNVLKIADLLEGTVTFKPGARSTLNCGGVPYSSFEVDISLPIDPEKTLTE